MEAIAFLAAVGFVLLVLGVAWRVSTSILGTLKNGRSKLVYIVTSVAALLVGAPLQVLARDWNVGAQVLVPYGSMAAVMILGYAIARRTGARRTSER